MKRWVKFWKLAHTERRLLFDAFGSLITVRAALGWLPLQRILKYLEHRQIAEISETAEVSAKQIAWAVRIAGRHLPGGGNCLVQSLAVQSMLARRGYVSQLRIGAAREGGEFKAHAWVECEGQIVIGAAGVSQYTPFPNLEFSRR